MRRVVAGVAILTSLIAVGCGASQKKKSNKSNGPSQPPFAERLQGSWKSDCLDMAGTQSYTEEYRFEGGVRTSTYTYYSATGCASGSERHRVVLNGAYKINGSNDIVEDTQEVSFTVKDSTFTILSDSATQAANTNRFCKQSDWAINTAKTVDGKDCDNMPFKNGGELKEYLDFDGQNLVSYNPTNDNDIVLKKVN